MDMQDLIATHTGCADYGEIEENLLFEMSAADYEEKAAEIAEFSLFQLEGAKVEMFFPELDGCTMYLSQKYSDGKIECLFVKVDKAGCKIYELKPKGGEIEDDKILCRM